MKQFGWHVAAYRSCTHSTDRWEFHIIHVNIKLITIWFYNYNLKFFLSSVLESSFLIIWSNFISFVPSTFLSVRFTQLHLILVVMMFFSYFAFHTQLLPPSLPLNILSILANTLARILASMYISVWYGT